MTQITKISKKQNEILTLIYNFYFLNTIQIQKLLHHKNRQGISKWLKDLKDKKYLNTYEMNENKFVARTEAHIYYLTKVSRQKLKDDENFEIEVLNRVYRSRFLSKSFVKNCLLVADVYINLLSQINKNEQLFFFTRNKLNGFDYFPSPIPDAYISIKKNKKSQRSFLIIINPKMTWRMIDQKIINYVNYTYDNDWNKYSLDTLPSFRLVCVDKKSLNHLSKIISDQVPAFPFYLTTAEKLKTLGFRSDIWKKIT